MCYNIVMTLQGDSKFAEITTSPAYREAFNDAFDTDNEAYLRQQQEANDIIYQAHESHASNVDADWDARRLATIARLIGVDLGPFNGYFQSLGGNARPSDEKTVHDLGEPGPVITNSIISGIKDMATHPIDFLSLSLDRIEGRKRQGPNSIGPENYATTLKYFADSLTALDVRYLDKQKISELVEKALNGFGNIAQKDMPNIVEMTNIYFAIRALPKAAVPESSTPIILTNSLEQLPTYHRKIFPLLFGALAKVPVGQYATETASLIDLALRQYGGFETTKDMRVALRALSNLTPCPESNQAFKTFLDNRHDLEDPLDLSGIDETNQLLLTTVNKAIDDPDLTLEAKEMAKTCATNAIKLYKKAESEGESTETELGFMHSTVDRAVENWSKI